MKKVIKGVWVTTTPTYRGKELSRLISFSYQLIEANLSSIKLFRILLALCSENQVLHVELVNNFKFNLILGLIKVFNKRTKIILDCHTVIFDKKELGKLRYQYYRFLIKNIRLVVHNEYEKEKLQKEGYSNIHVIHSPIRKENYDKPQTKTYNYDFALLSAAYNDLPSEIITYLLHQKKYKVFISGRFETMKDLPKNIIAPGYLAREDFITRVMESKVIIGLTNREDCLVLTGREGLALGKPTIVSLNKANKLFFKENVHYIENGRDNDFYEKFFEQDFTLKIDQEIYFSEYTNKINTEIDKYSINFF